MPKPKRNFAGSFDAVAERRQNNLQNKLEAANQRIAELEASVGEQVAQEIPLDMIEANPNQPRKSFYVVQRMKNLLAGQGQKQPIILVKIPAQDKYTIFDGECRYRGAKLLEWGTIKAVFIPYDPETFQEDVLISALNRASINALDEAEAIVRRIQAEIDLSATEIVDKLLSFISYTRRRGEIEALSYLTTNYNDTEAYIETLKFRDEAEKIICLTIAHLGRSCISISSNKFPLLKLSLDLKEVIRDRGLNERIALRLNTINPDSKKLKGKITKQKALKLRQELVDKILEKDWSVKVASEAIKNAIQEITGHTKSSLGQSYAKYLDRIKVEDLTQSDKELLLERLRNLITTIEKN
ncbi:MAG: ParB/RepB/Spo0J family partition protein [Xenococcaceae cyanobacterium MO_234.B1]|nr:ParB/RepB/Spo0J family partition protein [Xenococcaceae cyanobacterium MO_234.B1]